MKHLKSFLRTTKPTYFKDVRAEISLAKTLNTSELFSHISVETLRLHYTLFLGPLKKQFTRILAKRRNLCFVQQTRILNHIVIMKGKRQVHFNYTLYIYYFSFHLTYFITFYEKLGS